MSPMQRIHARKRDETNRRLARETGTRGSFWAEPTDELARMSAAEIVAIGMFAEFKRVPVDTDALTEWHRAATLVRARFIAEAEAGLALAKMYGKVTIR